MSRPSVGLLSLAVRFPGEARGNDYWRARYPEVVATARERTLSRVWSPSGGATANASPFLAAMAPFMDDPFRGAVSRRVLAPDEPVIRIELPAAQEALAAASMTPADVDLLLSSAFLPDQPGIGNAAFLASTLGLRCPAWNLETACSSALVSLETACALVQTGRYRRVLVVISCAYSKVTPEADTLSWSVGDGATAFVVGPVPDGEGVLGMKTLNTASHCGAMYFELDAAEGAPRVVMRAGREASGALRTTSEEMAVACCRGAAEAAGVSLGDIDFFAVPTPVAWYAPFCASLLGFPMEKTVNSHARYANTGPVLMPTNLHLGATFGKVKPGSLVMLHTVGIVANASACVMRWGNVGLGPPDEGPA